MKRIRLFQILVLGLMLEACTTSNVAYFQDLPSGIEKEIRVFKDIRLKPHDKVSIVVNSRDPSITRLFNLSSVAVSLGKQNGSYSGGIQGQSVYVLDKDGYIDFPVLGKVHLQGMNREEISCHIKKELEDNDLVKDPIVTVDFTNMSVAVLGEVRNPGRINIDRDRYTILDAISMAGDLTIQGKRENVMVQREEGNKRQIYRVDLNSASDLFDSPVYYLQQNDIVYVEPNSKKSRENTVNGNYFRTGGFWMSLASLIVSCTTLIIYRR